MEFKSIKPDIPSVFRFVEKDDSSSYTLHTYYTTKNTDFGVDARKFRKITNKVNAKNCKVMHRIGDYEFKR